MAQLFAYITHKNGALDDSAAELALAAAKIEAGARVTAIVTGAGGDLDAACQAAAGIYPVVWKFDHADLAYPNAEAIRKLLVSTCAIRVAASKPTDSRVSGTVSACATTTLTLGGGGDACVGGEALSHAESSARPPDNNTYEKKERFISTFIFPVYAP